MLSGPPVWNQLGVRPPAVFWKRLRVRFPALFWKRLGASPPAGARTNLGQILSVLGDPRVLPPANSRRYASIFVVSVLAVCLLPNLEQANSQELKNVELRNGMRLGPGQITDTASISTVSSALASPAGAVNVQPILILDNQLTRVHFNATAQSVLSINDSTAPPLEQFEFPSAAEVARSGAEPSILGILGVEQFNDYGRRVYSVLTPRGPVSVLQGITLLTADYAKVEVLRTKTDQFDLDQRISPTSIPADRLRQILYQNVDTSRSSEWLRMVRFYMQAQRYVEAREVMEEALEKFPIELADRRALLPQLDQLLAQQKFDEIQLRRKAGQRQLAAQLLLKFPESSLPLETQVELEREIKAIQQEVAASDEATKAVQACVAKLPVAEQQPIQSLIDELLAEVNLVTVARLVDFQTVRRDPSVPNENLVAYAISGWLLGPGSGLDNIAVATSLIRVRDLVQEYLNEESQPRRAQILSQLASEEGAQPQLMAKLLATMKPPRAAPPQAEGDFPGFYRVGLTRPDGTQLNYVVQLPPEYDPNQKYPCVLALAGRGDPPDLEINLWCGAPMGDFRVGQATRRGYIVVAPQWMTDDQTTYNYSEGEHDRILSCFRDSLRKFSIDTDRVFVTGHHDGATAAWDLAVSHPDLWAGAVMVSPTADKYIIQYNGNIRRPRGGEIPLATYIVYGQYDGTRYTNALGTEATRYLSSPTYDCLAVEYRGSGRMLFASEIPRIAEWMDLSSHRRIRAPQVIETKTMRSGDRFFYWLEAPAILPTAAGNPLQFDPATAAVFDAKILDPKVNGIVVSRVPSPKNAAIIWLTPEMIDINRTITITVQGETQRVSWQPSIEVMLEDVRRRGDRMHVFQQQVVF